MVLLDPFSKRQQRLGGELPDVYTFDAIPQPLRVQIVQIIGISLGVGMSMFKDVRDMGTGVFLRLTDL